VEDVGLVHRGDAVQDAVHLAHVEVAGSEFADGLVQVRGVLLDQVFRQGSQDSLLHVGSQHLRLAEVQEVGDLPRRELDVQELVVLVVVDVDRLEGHSEFLAVLHQQLGVVGGGLHLVVGHRDGHLLGGSLGVLAAGRPDAAGRYRRRAQDRRSPFRRVHHHLLLIY
jgi:hypothetical protein